ncbi:MAG: SPOR domain-containing protein [Desulfitobacteriia bacterium]|jgi:hypothetical protein
MRKKKYQKCLISALVVIIGIGAVIWFTLYLGRVFVGLASADSFEDSKPSKQAPASKILDLPDLEFWVCQLGVYSKKENAELQIENLKQQGWLAEIIDTEPETIAIGLFASREEALDFKKILAANNIEAWVRKEEYPALHYKANGKNVEEATLILSLCNSLLRGAEREEVKAKLPAGMELKGYSKDFKELEHRFATLLTKNYEKNDDKQIYKQELLGLFVKYKNFTSRFFPS